MFLLGFRMLSLGEEWLLFDCSFDALLLRFYNTRIQTVSKLLCQPLESKKWDLITYKYISNGRLYSEKTQQGKFIIRKSSRGNSASQHHPVNYNSHCGGNWWEKMTVRKTTRRIFGRWKTVLLFKFREYPLRRISVFHPSIF